jgi:signal transduction histidine kinase
VTATLPRTHLQIPLTPESKRVAVTKRWHRYRRITGLTAAALGLVAGLVLSWPIMVIVAVIGLAGAADATFALKHQRKGSNPTIAADILFTGVALVVLGAPGPAVGAVVAYFVLVVAVLGDSENAWVIGALAIVVGLVASLAPHILGLHDQPLERSVVAGVVIVAVFGISTIGVAKEFVRANRRDAQSSGRKIEIADAISAASRALVARDDIGAMGNALDAIRAALHVSVVFVERNVDSESQGICAVVDERSIDTLHEHPSFDRSASMPWSAMPGARSHLEGGAPFFYRVEEARGTPYDRGGESGIRVEVDVPIIIDDTWVGVIGAADDDPDRVWQPDDLILLRTLADLTAAVWQRTQGSRARESLIGNLDGRLRYEEGIAKASRALLGEQSSDLASALAAVGAAAMVDEVWVTETVSADEGAPAARITAVWTGSGILPAHDIDDEVSYGSMPEVRSAIQRDEVGFWSEEGSERVIVAINVAGAWYGTVAFARSASRSEARNSWSERDVTFCRTIADSVSAFFVRAQNRARLEHSLSSKDQLIASVGHELRTPLTVVVGLADELMTAGDTFDVDERKQLMEIVAESSREMADLVEDLLVAARSEDSSLPVFPDRIDLSLLAQSVVAQLTIPDGVDVEVEDADFIAFGDPVRVRQIIRNLLSNAFRYGMSPISVSASLTGEVVTLDVKDSGPGIPSADRERIFEQYRRADTSRTVETSVGLGLALSRRLARLMNGTLTYVDGSGTTFRLSLPRPSGDDT